MISPTPCESGSRISVCKELNVNGFCQKVFFFQLTWKCGKQRPTLPGRVPVSGRDTWNIVTTQYSKSNLVEDHKQTIITAKSKCYLDRITIFFAKYLLPQRRVLIVIQHSLPRIIEVQTDWGPQVSLLPRSSWMEFTNIYLLIYVSKQNTNLRA